MTRSKEAPFRVGLIQMSGSPEPGENLEKAVRGVREAAAQGAQIICLQELFRSNYFCQSEDAACFGLAEPVPGPSTELLSVLAAELDVVVIAPVFERRAAGLYHNSAVVIDAGGALLGIYRKMHIPDDPHFYEKFYFTPGDLGYRNFDTRYARIGVLICWDQWYPEAARLTALQGASILFYPTAIGWHRSDGIDRDRERDEAQQRDAWRTVQRSHAIANGVYVAAVNRTGYEGSRWEGLKFWGSSFLSGPFGEILAEASVEDEQILVADCDPRQLEVIRQHWPFLRDRRIDAYGGLTERWLG